MRTQRFVEVCGSGLNVNAGGEEGLLWEVSVGGRQLDHVLSLSTCDLNWMNQAQMEQNVAGK